MSSLLIILISGAVFMALVVNLALTPAYSARLTTFLMVVSVIGGLIIYGWGYSQSLHSMGLAVIRTPFSVVGMFLGKNDLSAIAGTAPVSSQAGELLFWLIHLMAFYSMASAAMITIGAEAVRHLRLILSRRGDLTIIYGINENCLKVGRECLQESGNSVVFIAADASQEVVRDINNQGMSVLTGTDAVSAAGNARRLLHLHGRKVTVYALETETDRNLFFAQKLCGALEDANVPPQDTRITLPGADDIITPMLQVSEDHYGYGYVNVFDPAAAAARAMIRMCPPWEQIRFDESGRALQDYDCAVVGFGRFGQEALRSLVMNGQFAGSTFHAAVFSADYTREAGYLLTDCPELMKQYDIRGYNADGRSREFYDYIAGRLSTLKLIAVCTGNDHMNREISDNLMLFLERRRAQQICVVQCSRSGVRYQESVGSPILKKEIFSREILSAEDADREAIRLNAVYDRSDKSDWDKWVACDAFSKMSSRASADFMPAYLRAAGREKVPASNEEWDLSAAQREVLGETEHRRWCAFHFASGYAAMTREQVKERGRIYRERLDKGEPCDIRITKDRERRLHACLIPWEELGDLSRLEKEATGREVDYRQIDINNVMALPSVLRCNEHVG